MAKRKEVEYESKAMTRSIKFTSRMSVKIRDTYYTVEACEERVLPEDGSALVDKERALLWNTVHGECEDQVQAIFDVQKRDGKRN